MVWLMKYPMQNNVWVGYFEDVQGNMDNMNQVIPLEFARYVLLHPGEGPRMARAFAPADRMGEDHAQMAQIHGSRRDHHHRTGQTASSSAATCPTSAAIATAPGSPQSKPSTTARTGDCDYKEAAYRTYNWVTYFQGLPAAAHAPFSNQWWFTDEFADGPRRMMDAFWAVPEWAPADESHLLGSLSVVTKIAYGAGPSHLLNLRRDSTDVLRLNFVPDSINVGGRPITRRNDLQHEGYTFDENTHMLRIRHSTSEM